VLLPLRFSLQETADGELVILHDFHLGDAFPNKGPNVEPYEQLCQQLGLTQDAVMPRHVKVSTDVCVDTLAGSA
jgi:glycerophosphoryl diester phosphodiesterase